MIIFKYYREEYYSHFIFDSKVRQRISYNNRKTSVIPLIKNKLFFILIYLKRNPLQELHAILFENTLPQINKSNHPLSEILRRSLKTLVELSERYSKRLFQGYDDVFLDETEILVLRLVQLAMYL